MNVLDGAEAFGFFNFSVAKSSSFTQLIIVDNSTETIDSYEKFAAHETVIEMSTPFDQPSVFIFLFSLFDLQIILFL